MSGNSIKSEMKATPRENLLRSLRRQGFDSVPIDSGDFCPSQVEAFRRRFGHDDVPGWFGSPSRTTWLPLRAAYSDPAALFPRETLPDDTSIDEWGVGHSRHPGCWHMTRMHHPLRGEDVTEDEIMSYPLPSIDDTVLPALAARHAALRDAGLASMGCMACTVWETAWYLRSMEDLMSDMMTGDDRATLLLDRVTAIAIERARAYARSGADIIQTGDDIGMQQTTMMSPELWREWLKPRLAKVVAAAREVNPDILVFYHSCGFVLPFLGELAEIGIDILNPVQPECMAFADAYAAAGGRLSFWGTIGTQRLLPFGTPDEVRETVIANLRICGAAGGIVIGPTHMVEPEVPWENLVAMKDAAESFSI